MTIGELLVSLKLDDKGFSAELKNALKQTQGFVAEHRKQFDTMHKAFSVASGIIVATAYKMMRGYIDTGNQLHKLSLSTGLSVEYLSKLAQAFKIADIDVSNISIMMRKFNLLLDEARTKGGEARVVLARLFKGAWKDLYRMTPDERFDAVMKALAGIQDESVRVALAQKVFGRGGSEALKLLDGGYEGFIASQQDAVVWTYEQAKSAADLNDEITRLKNEIFELQKTIIEGGLADTLLEILKRIKEIIIQTQEWVKQNPELVDSLTKIVGTGSGVIVVLSTLGWIVKGLMFLFGGATGVVGLWTIAISTWVAKWDDIKEGLKVAWELIVRSFKGFYNDVIYIINSLIRYSLWPLIKAIETINDLIDRWNARGGMQLKKLPTLQFGYLPVEDVFPQEEMHLGGLTYRNLERMGVLENTVPQKTENINVNTTNTIYVNNPLSSQDLNKIICAVEMATRQKQYSKQGL